MIARFTHALFLGILTAVAGTAIAQNDPEDNELTMVYLGASWMQRAAYLFSQQAAADLGVKVNFWQRNAGGQVALATAKLAAGGQWDLVDDADVVLVMLTGNFGRREGYCLDTPSNEPFSESPGALRPVAVDDQSRGSQEWWASSLSRPPVQTSAPGTAPRDPSYVSSRSTIRCAS